MNSATIKTDCHGNDYEVTIEKDKTLWMKLFKIPASITYVIRDSLWYNETLDRKAKYSEGLEIDSIIYGRRINKGAIRSNYDKTNKSLKKEER